MIHDIQQNILNPELKFRWIHIVSLGIISLVLILSFTFLYLQFNLNNLIFLIIGWLAILTIFYKPRYGLYAAICIAFSGIVWGFEIPYGFLGVVLLTGFTWLLHTFIKFDFSFPIDIQFIFIIGFLFFALFSCYFAHDQIVALKTFINYLKILIFYLLLIFLITKKDHFIILLQVLIISILFSIVFGFYDFLMLLWMSAKQLCARRSILNVD